MAFYENTLVARQDLSKKDLEDLTNKYGDLINKCSGKVIKIEKWGLINLAKRIKNYKKGFFIHYKFEGIGETLSEIEKRAKIDKNIIRYLTVKYKKLNTETEYFGEKKTN